jgi:hypothetical protein
MGTPPHSTEAGRSDSFVTSSQGGKKMGKTLKDRYPYVSRVHLRGFASLNIPEEDKQKWRASGGKTRAERKTGHQWTYSEAKAKGLRAYLRQIQSGMVFGYRQVKPIELVGERELVDDAPMWESGAEDDTEG